MAYIQNLIDPPLMSMHILLSPIGRSQTPSDVIERSPATHRNQFFELDDSSDDGHGEGGSQEEGTGDRSPGLARKVSRLVS